MPCDCNPVKRLSGERRFSPKWQYEATTCLKITMDSDYSTESSATSILAGEMLLQRGRVFYLLRRCAVEAAAAGCLFESEIRMKEERGTDVP